MINFLLKKTFGEHVLQKELVLFFNKGPDEFNVFAQDAETCEETKEFAYANQDSTGTLFESLELYLYSEDQKVFRERQRAAARFLVDMGVARGTPEEVFALLNLSGVELITIMP